MGLRRDRKGMIAIVDALVFVMLLSMAATWLFVFSNLEDAEEPMAKTISDDIFTMEIRISDVMDSEDTKVLPISTLMAAAMNTGRTQSLESFISQTLDQLIPGMYGYYLIVGYNGHTMEFHRHSDREMSSEYTCDHIIDGAGVLTSTLSIY